MYESVVLRLNTCSQHQSHHELELEEIIILVSKGYLNLDVMYYRALVLFASVGYRNVKIQVVRDRNVE